MCLLCRSSRLSLLRREPDGAAPSAGGGASFRSYDVTVFRRLSPRHWGGVDLAEGSPEDDAHDADVAHCHGEVDGKKLLYDVKGFISSV